jgi:hypothetical protein
MAVRPPRPLGSLLRRTSPVRWRLETWGALWGLTLVPVLLLMLLAAVTSFAFPPPLFVLGVCLAVPLAASVVAVGGWLVAVPAWWLVCWSASRLFSR